MLCRVTIDREPFEFELDGTFFWGNPECIFPIQNNAISKTGWAERGFSIIPLFSAAELGLVRERTQEIVRSAVIQAGGEIPNGEAVTLENYHRYVTTDKTHEAVIEQTRELRFKDFDFNAAQICERIGIALGRKVSHLNPKLDREIIIVRISRPRSLDINPPHRDGYLDIWKDTVNVWIPLAGCNEKTSLPVIPRSQLWPENEILRTENGEAKINGRPYRVPGIVDSKHGLNMTRPNPKLGEALIFTPFLVHGSAINREPDTTRVSFELRLTVDLSS